MKTIRLSLVLFGALAACVEGTTTSGGFMREVPEEVAQMAAPNQNLNTVKLMEDGCFWYQHVGPVETTMLPLLSTRGRPICTAREEEAPAAT